MRCIYNLIFIKFQVNYKGLDLVIGGRYPDQRNSYSPNNQATSIRNGIKFNKKYQIR